MYNSSLKYKWDNKNVRDYAMKEGMELGMAKGIELGMAKGEHKKALEIACACKKIGINADIIAKATGLSIEEIESL